MRAALFVPCLVEDFFPEIAEATALVRVGKICTTTRPAMERPAMVASTLLETRLGRQ